MLKNLYQHLGIIVSLIRVSLNLWSESDNEIAKYMNLTFARSFGAISFDASYDKISIRFRSGIEFHIYTNLQNIDGETRWSVSNKRHGVYILSASWKKIISKGEEFEEMLLGYEDEGDIHVLPWNYIWAAKIVLKKLLTMDTELLQKEAVKKAITMLNETESVNVASTINQMKRRIA